MRWRIDGCSGSAALVTAPSLRRSGCARSHSRHCRKGLGHAGMLSMSRRKPPASLAMIFLALAKATARAVIAWFW